MPNPSGASKQGYYCHPSFIRCPNGDLLISYIYGSGAVPYFGHNYYRRSADQGQTVLHNGIGRPLFPEPDLSLFKLVFQERARQDLPIH